VPSKSQDQKDSLPDVYGLAEIPNPYLTKNDLWAWGIDLSVSEIALATLPGSGIPEYFSASQQLGPRHNAGERLTSAFAAAYRLGSMLAFAYTPGVIAIELPFGTGANKLLPFVGAYMAGVGQGVTAVCGSLPPVLTPQPNEWKNAAGLPGNANKALIRQAWINGFGPDPTLSQDQIDAFFIGLFAKDRI